MQGKYLDACSDGAPAWKEIRFVINHSMKETCNRTEATCALKAGVMTYYGVQVVPIFPADNDPISIPQRTWLYRNGPLLRRSQNGTFTTSGSADDYVRQKTLDETPPSTV